MNFLLIGKPNVGKSSIYNILTTGKKNIIHSQEGTTRDWHKSNVKNYNNIFIYDTPGIFLLNNKVNTVRFSELFYLIDKFIIKFEDFELDIINFSKISSELASPSLSNKCSEYE